MNTASTDILYSVTCDQVSQLDHDTSAALATIREWKNSLAPVNHLPLDILSLIPTHLVFQEDRFRASFVCRHWRRTFLQRADLWTELLLSKGEDYTKTILERTKGSALIARAGHAGCRRLSAGTMTLLSSHTQRIRCLSFVHHGWVHIKKFADVSGFPLLDSLTIKTLDSDGPRVLGSTRLFSTAVDLKKFRLLSVSPPLNHFVFPNLVEFHLSVEPWEDLHALRLLDFLEASPLLQKVRIIVTDISFEGVPQGRVIVLPNAEHFELSMADGEPGYRLATHMSCPSARYVLFEHGGNTDELMVGLFPPPDLWNAIIHQYARSPAEEISVEFQPHSTSTCTLTLQSPDASVIKLRFRFVDGDGEEIRQFPDEVMNCVFVQATRAVRNHPQLPSVKRLRICYSTSVLGFHELSCVTDGVVQLLRSMGPLDELTIHNTDLRPYLYPFIDSVRGNTQAKDLAIFPPIKQLTISHPGYQSAVECTTAIAGLAGSQFASGIPFERVVVRGKVEPTGMEEMIRPWVGSVEYCYEEPCDTEDESDEESEDSESDE